MNSLKKTENSIHQHIEQLFRHRLALLIVIALLCFALVHTNSRLSRVMQQVYYQGFGWIGTYMHHEHPMHGRLEVAINRIPTTSGMG